MEYGRVWQVTSGVLRSLFSGETGWCLTDFYTAFALVYNFVKWIYRDKQDVLTDEKLDQC